MSLLVLGAPTPGQAQAPAAARESGPAIAVSEPLVTARCGGCHAADPQGHLQRISYARATPEGWQLAIQRMVREHDVALTPPDARTIVKYLSTRHGLAPAEARPVMYHAERRVHDEEATVPDALYAACGRCHVAAVALSWRRSPESWRLFADGHAARYKFTVDSRAIDELASLAPFTSPDWTTWSARGDAVTYTGRWLVTAHVQGHGVYYGEMEVEPAEAPGEFRTRTRLRSVVDGSEVVRTGRSVIYGGTAWRGRSQGTTAPGPAPDDLRHETREAMWVAPDGGRMDGRWFWGQYDEFGIDVRLQRPAGPSTLLAVSPAALQVARGPVRLRLFGAGLPVQVATGDVAAGDGVIVRRIVSATPGEIVVEVEVAAAAVPGVRRVTVKTATGASAATGEGPAREVALDRGITVFDRVDYVKVTPESSLASFGSRDYAPGFQAFEAIGMHRGADGKAHTDDDLELDEVAADWSLEVFYDTDPSRSGRVGTISTSGFFTPAAASPGTNFDVSVIATAKTDVDANGKRLVGKGYLVVTVPTYTFEGRTFVRELGRWIETEASSR